MRDYIFHQALSRDSTFLFPKLRRVIRNWFAKRNLRGLDRLDDYMLNDIGLTRADLAHIRGLPCDVDPIEEMTRIRDRRMRKGVRAR
jgi:uncharacterized protein YjiS (DUF1127 family)